MQEPEARIELTSSDLVILIIILKKFLRRDVGGRTAFVDGEVRLRAQGFVRVFLEFLAQFVDFGGEFDDDIGEWIANVFGVGDDHAMAVAQDDVAGHADDGGVGGHAAQHDGAGADAAVVSDGDVAQDFCAGTHDDVVAERGMALAFVLAGAAEGDALVEGDVVAYDGSFADDRPGAVIDEEAAAEFGTGMDFDSGEQARDLREPAGEESQIMTPQPVREMVRPDGVKAGIAEKNFRVGARGRVGLEDGGDIFAYGMEEAGQVEFPFLSFQFAVQSWVPAGSRELQRSSLFALST